MNVDGKNFDMYLTAMWEANHQERETLLKKAMQDKDVTVAGWLKLENFAISMDGKGNREK